MKPVCVVVVLLSCINVSYTCPSACSCSGNTVNCYDKNLEEIPSGIPVTTHKLQVFCCVENEGSDDVILEIFKSSRINNVETCCEQYNVSKHPKKRIIGFQYNDIRMTLHTNTGNPLLLINQRFYTLKRICVYTCKIQRHSIVAQPLNISLLYFKKHKVSK